LAHPSPVAPDSIPPIRCPQEGCGFEQRHVEIAAAPGGYTAVSHRCENGRCRRWMIVLLRIAYGARLSAKVVGTQPRLGRDESSYRASLVQFPELRSEDGPDHIDCMVAVAKLFGWLTEPGVAKPTAEAPARRRRMLRPGIRPSQS
jgi:hypothetical protein